MGVAIIILAAGNSARLGKPKQLLTFGGSTLLNNVISEALKTQFRPIIVVLGAYETEIKSATIKTDVTFVLNENWENGMSSSISIGLQEALKANAELESVILAVADQVYLNAAIFEQLVSTKQQTDSSIIASAYLQTKGTPTLFDRTHFEELLNLKGSDGAKSIIKRNLNDIVTIPFDLGAVDIDTETDYNNLINNK